MPRRGRPGCTCHNLPLIRLLRPRSPQKLPHPARRIHSLRGELPRRKGGSPQEENSPRLLPSLSLMTARERHLTRLLPDYRTPPGQPVRLRRGPVQWRYLRTHQAQPALANHRPPLAPAAQRHLPLLQTAQWLPLARKGARPLQSLFPGGLHLPAPPPSRGILLQPGFPLPLVRLWARPLPASPCRALQQPRPAWFVLRWPHRVVVTPEAAVRPPASAPAWCDRHVPGVCPPPFRG